MRAKDLRPGSEPFVHDFKFLVVGKGACELHSGRTAGAPAVRSCADGILLGIACANKDAVAGTAEEADGFVCEVCDLAGGEVYVVYRDGDGSRGYGEGDEGVALGFDLEGFCAVEGWLRR